MSHDVRPEDVRELQGVFYKDKELSDSMEGACDLADLGWLMRKAIGLIVGVSLTVGEGYLEQALLPVTGLGWFKLRERYPLSGEPTVTHQRRDFRKGSATMRLSLRPEGGVRVDSQWPDPLAGQQTEVLYLASPDVLHIDTELTVGDRSVRYRSVYRRKK